MHKLHICQAYAYCKQIPTLEFGNGTYNKGGIFNFLLPPSLFVGGKRFYKYFTVIKRITLQHKSKHLNEKGHVANVRNWHLLKLLFHLNEKGHVPNVGSAAQKVLHLRIDMRCCKMELACI